MLPPRVRPMVLAPALLVVAALLAGAGDLHPVVLVPGYGSNQLEAMLTAAYEPPAPACAGAADHGWFPLWPNHTAMRDASQVPCFADQMSLVYDAGADDYRDAVGVATRTPYFGSARALIGWDRLVQQLEGMGYRDGETLYAAPYDFRYAVAPPGHPSAVGDRYFRDLGRLIQASRLNQGRPAIVVAHSFGCALTYQLLLSRPLAWRRRYVKRVVLLGPALGGFAAGMYVLSAGMDYGLPNVTRPTMLRLARSQQSALWRLPTPLVFGDRPLAVTRTATYSARNMSEFLEAIGFAEGVRPYLTRVLPMWEALPAPMVPVTSVIGFGVRTPETYVFGTDGLEGEAEVLYGDGDGDINMVSLAAVEKWSEVEGQVLKVVRLPGVHHEGFFSTDFAVKSIIAEISEAGESIEQIGVVSCEQKCSDY
ncbi:lecithin-cholesterol acyltransferase-like 1 [Miscanthus floridulus]|uniref:lecithin-cholesterol acyltransferase-like 1 n=1 Tax=Miscanthus floridulus TaxID=154761 RepID=UPI00345B2F4C